MYTRQITHRNPGCLMFLVDRSESMSRPWAGSRGLSLAEGAAQAVNLVLMELCLMGRKEITGPSRHYFDIGVFGYGGSAFGMEESVESALTGALAGRPLVSLTEVSQHPLGIGNVITEDGDVARIPVWLEPIHGSRTPMCEAFATAAHHLHDWVTEHCDAFPPIVINITDGVVTDSPYQGVDLTGWAHRIRSLATEDGSVLLFNVFLSSETAVASVYPSSGVGLPDPGPMLFDISSELPPTMAEQARSERVALLPGARGLCFNADLATLARFLDMGTRVGTSRIADGPA